MKTIILGMVTIFMLLIVTSDLNDLVRLIALFIYIVIFSYLIIDSSFVDKILRKLNK
jgi:hypothetical protein